MNTDSPTTGPAPQFDWEEYFAASEEVRDQKWPHTKVSFPGERLWARQISPGFVMLDNDPLEPGYFYADICTVSNGNVGQVVSRTFGRKYGFKYGEPEEATRQAIGEASLSLGSKVSLSFFVAGLGFLLVRETLPEEDVVRFFEGHPAVTELVLLKPEGGVQKFLKKSGDPA